VERILDERRTCVRALAQPNGAHLRKRSHGLRLAFADELDSGMKVVLTAPMPGSSTPSFPLAGAILEGFSMPLLLMNDRHAICRK